MRTGQSAAEALDSYVQFSTGEKVPTRSLIWCVGVRPDPLVVPLSGPAANAVTRDYHLFAKSGNQLRVLADCRWR